MPSGSALPSAVEDHVRSATTVFGETSRESSAGNNTSDQTTAFRGQPGMSPETTVEVEFGLTLVAATTPMSILFKFNREVGDWVGPTRLHPHSIQDYRVHRGMFLISHAWRLGICRQKNRAGRDHIDNVCTFVHAHQYITV